MTPRQCIKLDWNSLKPLQETIERMVWNLYSLCEVFWVKLNRDEVCLSNYTLKFHQDPKTSISSCCSCVWYTVNQFNMGEFFQRSLLLNFLRIDIFYMIPKGVLVFFCGIHPVVYFSYDNAIFFLYPFDNNSFD